MIVSAIITADLQNINDLRPEEFPMRLKRGDIV